MDKPAIEQKADQADIIASLAKANSDLAAANTTISNISAANASLQAKADAATASTAALNGTIASLTKERDDARAEVATLKAKDADLEKAVAARVAQLGISTQKPAGTSAGGQKQELNLTQQCLAAKGLPADSTVTL